MGILSQSITQEELENKKKSRVDTENVKTDVTSCLEVKLKVLKSLSALKRSTYARNTILYEAVDLMNSVYAGLSETYLHLMVDDHLDRDCVERQRIRLSRLFSSLNPLTRR